jgi:hypothetical protein
MLQLQISMRHARGQGGIMAWRDNLVLMDPLHKSLRALAARPWAVRRVAFLANSRAIGGKKTPCAPSQAALPPSREVYAEDPMKTALPSVLPGAREVSTWL